MKTSRLIACLLAFGMAAISVFGQPEERKLTHYQENRDRYRSVHNDGKPMSSNMKMKDPRGPQLVKRGVKAPKGLEGRHIAMWQSHGRYFDLKELKWKWQRPSLFQTSEDLFTQSFLVQFLVPMLENAGANVILPRERDWHDFELVIDNDSTENESSRTHGYVEYNGSWKKKEGGFADSKSLYTDEENPFEMGSFLSCNALVKKGKESSVTWFGEIPARDEYGVYVSYKTLPKSTSDARYTVYTAGGAKEVTVNQRMGGGSWVYLGKFELEAGRHELVSLSSRSSVAGVVSADAVKIGGGLGNIARGIRDSTELCPSCMPRFAEGARYYLQWSGIPSKVWSQNEFGDDYRDDLMSRGEWVQYLCGGSWANPKKEGLNIPIDMSLAWHTDAGSKPDDTIVGTLGIYTLKCKGSTRLPNGTSRGTSRELTELLLSQIEKDFTAQWDSLWTIRDVWNKSYSESRTTGTPAVLLELLSHQNFEDMKYGLDPAFRFSAARAVYKAILKYLSMRYSCAYKVQPLPVKAFSAMLCDLSPEPYVRLRWKETEDRLEPTAEAEYFMIYTRKDDGGWDAGQRVEASGVAIDKTDGDAWFETRMPIEAGHLYSYKIVAANAGGLSFPSEILAAGMSTASPGELFPGKVSVVNAFHRVSGPKWFDTPYYAGFDNRSDSGVPYKQDWAFVGEQFEYNRSKQYTGGVDSGFGACYEDYMDKVIGGNSFDYPAMHGRVLMKAGYSFDSCSIEALDNGNKAGEDLSGSKTEEFLGRSKAVDIICGKECRVKTGSRSPERGGIYTQPMMDLIRYASDEGKGILISGAYIAKEAEDAGAQTKESVREFLGITLRREHGSRTGNVHRIGFRMGQMSFPMQPCAESYCVESPDALGSYRMGSKIIMEYTDSHLAAGVHIDFGGYRVAAFGFPLEILSSSEDFSAILEDSISYICR